MERLSTWRGNRRMSMEENVLVVLAKAGESGGTVSEISKKIKPTFGLGPLDPAVRVIYNVGVRRAAWELADKGKAESFFADPNKSNPWNVRFRSTANAETHNR